MTTRLIGALIMVHGDNEGLVIPPRVAPIQICIVPVMQKKEGVLDKAYELRDRLAKDFRVKVDDSDKTPGFKFAEAEMRGYPIRVEIGPKDIEAGKCVICRRDTREKTEVALEDLETKAAEILETMQKEMPWREQEHIVTAILMWHITWKSSSRSSTKSPDSSRLCGADARNVKTRSRKSLL